MPFFQLKIHDNWQEFSVTPGSLTSINTSTLQIDKVIQLHDGKIPIGLDCNDNLLYFKNGETIYNQSVFDQELNATEIVTGNFDNEIIIYENSIFSAYVPGYDVAGEVYQYSLNGELQNTFQVGIAPGNFGF